MFFLILLLLFVNTSYCNQSGCVGSVLFHKRSSKDCWNRNDLAKLRARMIFEQIMLPTLPLNKIDTKYNRDMITYFKRALRQVEHKKDSHILKEVLADTIGAHMRQEILPNARFAYYAGYIGFDSVNELQDFFQVLKNLLNTQGVGWKEPGRFPKQANLTVAKILIAPDSSFDPCVGLIIKRYDKKCIYIPMPKVDDEKKPAALALPYKTGGFVSLLSPNSENILLKYYTKAARCILHSSPEECRQGDFLNFNNDLWHWMKKYVAPHLMDEELYSGYGGVLRVAAAVQSYGKGMSRRHLFMIEEKEPIPMFSMDDNKNVVCKGNMPPVCVIVIFGAALAVCCLHIIYNYVCGPSGSCNCPGKEKRRVKSEDVAYTNVDLNFPAMLPPPNISKCTDESIQKGVQSSYKSKATSVASTQKDFKDNLPNVMSTVISEMESSSTDDDNTTLNRTLVGSIRTSTNYKRPPKCEVVAPAQLKIERAVPTSPRVNRNIIPTYSTTNVSVSEATRTGQISESCLSESYTSERSESSFNSTSQGRPSRRSRDLAWAQKVVSKQILRSTSVTDYELNSNTASTTRR